MKTPGKFKDAVLLILVCLEVAYYYRKIPFSGGPGPKYVLPSLTGFEGHDPTRRRYPASALGVRLDRIKRISDTPGPKYDIGRMTKNGINTPPSCILGAKPKYTFSVSPGPDRYAPEQYPDVRFRTPPSCSLGTRRSFKSDIIRSPGAVNYKKPTTIGPQVPDLRAAPAYTILGRPRALTITPASPGPGRYGVSQIDAYKQKARSAIILGPRPFQHRQRGTPGPKYAYTFNEKVEPPAYTFGVRHTPYQTILYLPEDKGEHF